MPDLSKALREIPTRPLGDKIMLASAAATFVCAFLPWVSIFGISVAGIRGDGQITAGTAVVAGLALLVWSTALDRQLAIQGLAAVIVIAVSGYHAFDDFAGAGAQLSLLAGIVWAAGLYIARREARAARAIAESSGATTTAADADPEPILPVREVDERTRGAGE